MRKLLHFLHLLLYIGTGITAQAYVNPRTEANGFSLEFPQTPSGTGVCICHKGHTLFFQDNPIQFIVYHPGTKTAPPEEASHVAPYSQVKHVPEGILACGILHTAEGIVVHFSDLYQTSDGIFTLCRKVKVTAAPPNGTEMGFATAYAIQSYAPCTPDAYEYFIPSILYRNTKGMHPHAIAADLQVNRMYVKETRTGMPMAMLRDMHNGIQLSLLHHPDIETAGYPNGGQPGIIDNAIRFGSLGYSFSPRLSVDFRFPSAEGPRSYEPHRRSPSGSPWIGRYHRLRHDAMQTYTLYLIPDCQDSFQKGMTAAYVKAFETIALPIADMEMDSIYEDNLQLFKSEYREYGTGNVKAAGLPWSLDLPDGTNREGVSFQMGFVGQQIAVGYHLLRYGLQRGDEATRKKGETIVDFWTSPAIMDSYFPTVWWDPADNAQAGRRREYPTFLRCMIDGMEGLLDACRITKTYGQARPKWERALERTAMHLVEKQEDDGAFRRAYRTNGEVESRGDHNTQGYSKLNTPIAVRFLTKMYRHTGDRRYKAAALKAADFAYKNLFQDLGKYVGGTPDNPNTVDKESAIFALYAFNAAYELSGNKKYLDAAEHAACCAMSWVYCYNFAIPNRNEDDCRKNPFAHGGTSGFSIISTGHSGADNFAAYLCYEMFKLYVHCGKPHFRDMALFLQNNTKCCTDFDGRMGYKYRAFMPEATNIADMAFRSVRLWLPWSGIANVEPITQMKDTFGENDIRHITNDLDTLRQQLASFQVKR